jgi:hypothetical protein
MPHVPKKSLLVSLVSTVPSYSGSVPTGWKYDSSSGHEADPITLKCPPHSLSRPSGQSAGGGALVFDISDADPATASVWAHEALWVISMVKKTRRSKQLSRRVLLHKVGPEV